MNGLVLDHLQGLMITVDDGVLAIEVGVEIFKAKAH